MTGRAQNPPPVDLDDALAVVAYGQVSINPELDARLAQAMDSTSAAALVARMDELRRALQADNPRLVRRGVGLLGRLAGRDVEAEAQAQELKSRLVTLIAAADRSAAALSGQVAAQQLAHEDAAAAATDIDAAIAQARHWLENNPTAGTTVDAAGLMSPRQRLEQRLHQLAGVRDAHALARHQMQLLRDQNLDLLARYQHIRDTLLPVWRQQAIGQAGRGGSKRAAAAARASAAIASEVDAMAGRLDRDSRPPDGEPA